MRHSNLLAFAVVAALSVASAQAASPRHVSTAGVANEGRSLATTLSPAARGMAIHAFVSKWGVYVQNTYGIDVHEWAHKMVGQFAVGDAVNIQRALQRDTFEGAMAELDGVGHRLSDTRAIDVLARASPSITPTALGDIDKDLVYTPVPPCRIVDTRLAGGPVASNTSRPFGTWGYSSFTFQGGSATNCGMQSQHPTTAVFNVTAVTPAGGGYATVYSGALASPPTTASINYSAGAVVNNSVLTDINPASSPDFKIYSFATSDYVVDIVGFYDNPLATPLECNTTESFIAVAAGSSGVSNTQCPAGFTMTGGGGYWLGGANNGPVYVYPTTGTTTYSARGYNLTGGSQNLYTRVQCCRVPGR